MSSWTYTLQVMRAGAGVAFMRQSVAGLHLYVSHCETQSRTHNSIRFLSLAVSLSLS
jgi:hypothetical protein